MFSSELLKLHRACRFRIMCPVTLQSWALDAVAGPPQTTSSSTANPAALSFCKPCHYQRACLMVPEPMRRKPQMTGQVEGMDWDPRKDFGVDVLWRKSVDNLHADILLDREQDHHVSCLHLYSQALAYYLACRKGSISLCWNELKLNFKFRITLSKGRLPVTIAN